MVQQAKLDKLETVIDRMDEDDPDLSGDELRSIVSDLETGTKYKCATCTMFCTGEDVMIIYDTEEDEFIQIEVPMSEDEDVIVTRVS